MKLKTMNAGISVNLDSSSIVASITDTAQERLSLMNFYASLRARFALICCVISCFAGARPLAAQQSPSPVTLAQAVNIALDKNPARKAALADLNAATADTKQARAMFLPRAMFSESATVSNDPVYVFGSKLRQQRFGASDFALSALNTPGAFGNFSTRFGGSWNVFDSFATQRAVSRAGLMKDAAGHQLARADQEIVMRVIEAYYGVLLARKELDLAGQAVQTAQSILDQSKNRFESGVVVQSDYLGAQVRIASRRQELIRAQNNVALARAQLSMAMGLSAAGELNPAEALEEKGLPSPNLEDAEKKAVQMRPDLKQADSQVAAQQKSVEIAKAAFGPRVNAFASWQADNAHLFSGGGNNWIAGMEVQLDLFQGGAKRAQLAKDSALEEKAAALKQMATDGVRLEVQRAFYDLDAARRQIDVARTSIAESKEAFRIHQDRYQSGLATITDMLTAEDAMHRSETDYWEAVYRYHTSYAHLEFATGTLNSDSPAVMP